ncbi:MAG TPA: chemotaxis-specific protein-glutamate methyltransferase CheB [bacterium]|nr:chemotaxis-specific protein-glutamate methyltransferase CheB [bacterium]
MIKVLITEDSPVVRGYLKYILDSDPDIEVVGTASDGEEAVKMVKDTNPDVVTMDIHMPKMDGYQATRRIMETSPVPIVICSASWNPEEVEKTFRTMEAGAVAALEKPRGPGHPDSDSSVGELLNTVKLMSGVKVVRRWSQDRHKVRETKIKSAFPETPASSAHTAKSDHRLIAVGSSTGGPLVLQTLLAGLPKDFPLPVVIVQHIASGFLAGLCEWLGRTTGFRVRIPENGEKLLPGYAYLAPDKFQIAIDPHMKVVLTEDHSGQGLCPSVSHLFNSVVNRFGKKVIAVLLTGMGKDGAAELKKLHDLGAFTIAQDKETSVVHGMPGEAIKLGGASAVLPSAQIAEKLIDLVVSSKTVDA